MDNYKVGESYKAKSFNQSGFNFPDGEYKLKIIREGFPESPVNHEDELVIAEEQWLEGLEGSAQYRIDLEGNWYYFEFPINDEGIDYMWVPESVVVDIF
jgi:hypothetical protein